MQNQGQQWIRGEECELMNVALMSKWKWRLVQDQDAIWIGILEHMYGYLNWEALNQSFLKPKKNDSIW